jgi:high-affinity iron transporter
MQNQIHLHNNAALRTIFGYMSMITLFIAAAASSQIVAASTNAPQTQYTAQKMLHILDYVAVDYGNVIQNGAVVNQSEYREQVEFTARLIEEANNLPQSDEQISLRENAAQLHQAVQQRLSGEKVAALCNTMSLRLIEIYDVAVVPRTAPAMDGAAGLYAENCSACHGAQGFGDGPNSAALQPAPANFHDRERQQHRSVFSLYNTISLGVAGTAMPAFDNLSNEQRWQLAFFVSNFFATDGERAKGEAFLTETKTHPAINNLRQLTQTTPAQAATEFGEDAVAELAYLRANPADLQSQMIKPLNVARDNLNASVVAYQSGDVQSAYDHAVAAYLEGFELVETPLNAIAPELRQKIETSMLQYRKMIKNDASYNAVQQSSSELIALLSSAEEKLHAKDVSSTVNFLSAFLILLREGIEAILILAAISAVLMKTGRPEMMRYLHFGWIAALLLGGLTWYVAGTFINISGANREITEGVTALVAAAMLIYVGFWLHNQTNAIKWQHFIRTKVSQSLTNSALTGLAVVAFLAVYREVFESILFFNTLWLQTDSQGQGHIVSGMLTAVVLLVLIAWGVFKFSVRLPLKLFFRINSVFLYLLAIVFAGKGIAALQEAGKLPVDPVHFFQIDALGIYPTAESLGAQAALIAIAMSLVFYSRFRLSRNQAEEI